MADRTYSVNVSLPEYVRLYLANFIFAFLVVGWFTGHVVRVIRQQKVEDSLQTILSFNSRQTHLKYLAKNSAL